MPIARTLFTEDKKLRVFDFDDTLVKTNSFIYVTDKDGKKSKLSPGQYAVYKERPGDVFDYTDFQKVTEPKLIKGYVELLRRMVNSGGSREVFILTARSAEKPVSKFIKDLGIRGVTVVALGDANPEKKADWIEDKVKAGFDDVYFIDDSPKNVEAVRKRLKNYPNVKQKIQQVKPKEEMESQSTKLISMLPKADLTKTIKNPDTGRDIKLKSALQYDKDSKVFKAAEKMIKK